MRVKRTSPWTLGDKQGRGCIVAGAEWIPSCLKQNPFVSYGLSSHVSVPPSVCLTALLLLISTPQRVPSGAHSVRSSSLLLPLLQNIQFYFVRLRLPAEFPVNFTGSARGFVDPGDRLPGCRPGCFMAQETWLAPLRKIHQWCQYIYYCRLKLVIATVK